MSSSILILKYTIFFLFFFDFYRCSYGDPKEYNMDFACVTASDNCICIMEVLLREMKSLLLFQKGQELENRIKNWKCVKFLRIPDKLVLDGKKDGLILNNLNQKEPAEIVRNVENYQQRRFRRSSNPKPSHIFFGAPTHDAFEEAMAKIDPNAFHQYVNFGSTAKFKCAGPVASDLVDLEGRIEKITWTHFNGDEIPLKVINHEETGVLEIPSVGLTDVDIYNCTVHYNDDSLEVQKRTFNHQLSVVTEPLFLLELSVKHKTSWCNAQEATLLQEAVGIWIEKYISKFVVVHHTSVTCENSIKSTDNFDSDRMSDVSRNLEEYVYIHGFRVSDLGLELNMHSASHVNSKTCETITCLEQIQTRIMETIRDSLTKIFKLPIEVKDSLGQKVMHPLVDRSLELELKLGCLDGFALRYKLCFPCDPGYYSHRVNMDAESCIPCPMGTYQPQPASGICLSCPDEQFSLKNGSTSRLDCYSEAVVDTIVSAVGLQDGMDQHELLIGGFTGGLLFVIIILILSICYCCPKTGCAKCLKKFFCCCCAPDSTQEKVGLISDSEDEQRNRKKVRQKKKTTEAFIGGKKKQKL